MWGLNEMAEETRCVVITGATGGIGTALARRLAADGWRLHLCDVDIALLTSLAKALPPNTTVCESQLESPEACCSALPDTPATIDALVHLAGIFDFHGFDQAGREVYNQTLQHNATNAYDLTAAILPRMPRGGRIVYTSSLAFNRGAPDNISYSMAKGALVGLTRALSRKLAPDGILVNAVAPGFIESPMLTKVMAQRNEQDAVAMVPLGRLGKASEVAGVLAFLLSDDASYVTGQLINIDGGMINS